MLTETLPERTTHFVFIPKVLCDGDIKVKFDLSLFEYYTVDDVLNVISLYRNNPFEM